MGIGVWWYESGEGGLAGPFTGSQIAALIAEGVVSPEIRFWSSETKNWRPFGAAAEAAERQKPMGRRGGVWRRVLLPLVSLVYLLLLAGIVDLLAIDGTYPISPGAVEYVWPTIGLALVLTSIASICAWWSFAGQDSVGSELSGLIRISSVLFALVGLATATQELRQSSFASRSAVATSSWTYTVGRDPERHLLIIKGDVGSHFGVAVERGLAALKDPVSVEISSQGGLVDEALRAARAIQARPGATVIARGWCASACLIVLVSADHRLADYGSYLSFHAPGPIVDTTDRLLSWSVAQQGLKADAYLKQRGVPSDIVDETERLGPKRLNSISAPDALDRGVLTGLVDGNMPISENTARRRIAGLAIVKRHNGQMPIH